MLSQFHSQNLKKYGFDGTLSLFLMTLKNLKHKDLKCLGLHGLFWFVESFSATYCCRFCLISKDELHSVFTEDDPSMVFHSKEICAGHCSALQNNPWVQRLVWKKTTTKPSLLNTLNCCCFFHTSDNYVVDIMHDLLEGVVQYVLKLVFQYLVNQKCLSLESLSQRIQSFNYG